MKMIKVHIFHTGQVVVDDAIPHGSKNPPGHSHGLFTAFVNNGKQYLLSPEMAYTRKNPSRIPLSPALPWIRLLQGNHWTGYAS